MTRQGRRAISILSGFLGSGKTTLLRRYLAEQARGDIARYHQRIWRCRRRPSVSRASVEDQSILLQGGCVCCGRREELVGALRDLLDQKQGCVVPMRRVVIETSGLADPVPVMFSLATDPVLQHQFDAPLVVVTLAAVDAEVQIGRCQEVRKQIIAADRVVITKSDLTTRQEVARCRVAIRALNPTARIIVSRFGEAFEALAPRAGRQATVDGAARSVAARRSLIRQSGVVFIGIRQLRSTGRASGAG